MANKDKKHRHFTYRNGTPLPKKRYSRTVVEAKRVELADKYPDYVFEIYLCPICHGYHVGTQKRDSGIIYVMFGHMLAAMMRGKTTPPLQTMLREPPNDV